MSKHTAGAWRYFRNCEGSYSVYPAKCDEHTHFPRIVLAEVQSFKNLGDQTGEANARLIASAPEMHTALIGAVEALRATEVFMCGQGLETDTLNAIIRTIDELLDRVDGTEA